MELLITGHSLGAGVACILSYLLKPAYPHLTCITHGTPNSVFDPITAMDCADYMTSVSNQHDVVSRMGYKPCLKVKCSVSYTMYIMYICVCVYVNYMQCKCLGWVINHV